MQKVVQIKAFGIQSKTNIHRIDGQQLTEKNSTKTSGEYNVNFYFVDCLNKERHDKTGTKTNELEMESSQTIVRSVGGFHLIQFRE